MNTDNLTVAALTAAGEKRIIQRHQERGSCQIFYILERGKDSEKKFT